MTTPPPITGDIVCAFCGKTQEMVHRLVAGPGLYICDECIAVCHNVIHEDDEPQSESPEPALHQQDAAGVQLPKPKEIKDWLDKHIIGQHYAKEVISVAVYNHYKRIFLSSKQHPETELQKSNILLVGPTGTGKTLIAQTLAKLLNVPFTIADATTLTESGYVGEDVESMLFRLLQVAGNDVKKAEMGIIYLDEIDKISRKSESASITRDVSGEGVQQALLKLLEGSKVNVPCRGGRKHPHQDHVTINTENILFITGGAFYDIEKIIEKRLNNTQYGFLGKDQVVEKVEEKEILTQVQPEDLLGFGLIPEFIGRLPVIAALHQLEEQDLVRILKEPNNALVKQFQKLMHMDDIELEFEDAALTLIAKIAIRRKVGARALRGILEELMLRPMFDLPGEESNKSAKFTLTESQVLDYINTKLSPDLKTQIQDEIAEEKSAKIKKSAPKNESEKLVA